MTRNVLIIQVLLWGAACSTAQRSSTEQTIARVLISDEEERKLGLQVHEELGKKDTKFLTSGPVQQYVEALARKLLPLAQKERPLSWSLYVIDDAKTVNAFATPGGRIYVYTGLLASAESEAEVIGVLGHEMGHVVARHSARQLVQAYGLEAVIGMALGQKPNELARVAAQLAGTGLMLAHSRADEDEADEFGARYAAHAGYSPFGLVSFFERLARQNGDTPGLLAWLSTHPPHADRIAHVQRYVAQQGLRGDILGKEPLAEVKKAISR